MASVLDHIHPFIVQFLGTTLVYMYEHVDIHVGPTMYRVHCVRLHNYRQIIIYWMSTGDHRVA